jgi:hypothetical protein
MSAAALGWLDPEVTVVALDLARRLQQAAVEVGLLTYGHPAGQGGQRSRARDRAATEWVGPHANTFGELCAHEVESAQIVRARLEAEADAWAALWAEATNERARRLHDEAMADHRRALRTYEADLAEHHLQLANHHPGLHPPSPPDRPGPPPRAPVPVPVPTAASGYRRTG